MGPQYVSDTIHRTHTVGGASAANSELCSSSDSILTRLFQFTKMAIHNRKALRLENEINEDESSIYCKDKAITLSFVEIRLDRPPPVQYCSAIDCCICEGDKSYYFLIRG